MSYTERYVLVGKETAGWGNSVDPANTINYLLRWEATTAENKIEEPVIGGGRDLKGRVWTTEEVTGVLEQQLVTGALFQYVLGTIADTTASPAVHTLTPDTVVPAFTAIRAIRGPTEFIQYVGCKVDSAELTCEAGEDVTAVFNFVAQSATTIADSWGAPGVDVTLDAYGYYQGEITYGGNTLADVQRIVITFNNNLEARYAVGGTVGSAYGPQEIREGAFEVSGRVLLGSAVGSLANQVFGRGAGVTIVVTLTKTLNTMEITLNNCVFGEFPESMAGLEPFEVELPFTARAIGTAATERAVFIVHTGNKGTFDDYVA